MAFTSIFKGYKVNDCLRFFYQIFFYIHSLIFNDLFQNKGIPLEEGGILLAKDDDEWYVR